MKEARAWLESGSAYGHSSQHSFEIRSITDAVQGWLNTCEKIGRNGREKVERVTLDEYRRRAGIIKSYPWNKSIQELQPSDIVRFRDWLLHEHSRNTSRKTLSSFHSVIIEMRHQGQIKDDPAAGISIKSDGRYEADGVEVEIPSDSEVRSILEAADQMGKKNPQMKRVWLRHRPLIYLAIFSGMRPSELRGLPWNCVRDGAIDVRQRADRYGSLGPVKSRAGRRTIFVPKLVSDMIFEWKAHCPASEYDLVFPTASGKPQMLGMIRRGAWVPLLREVGLVEITNAHGKERESARYPMYSMRHYFASKMISSGADLKFIQESMGHSTIEITFNVYGHLLKEREDERRAVAEGLASSILQ